MMRRPFLVGEKIYLRPLEAADLDGPYLDWLNEHEITRYLETGMFPTTRESLQDYVQAVARGNNNVMLAIADRASDAHVGNVKLGPIHWLHRRADMGILIGDRTVWGRGYGREAVALVVDYGFHRLNLHKIALGVYADNVAAVKMYQKIGFCIEGTLRQHLFMDGAYHDKYVMGILREQYAGAPSA